MSPEQKKELVRHWYEDVLSGGINTRNPSVAAGIDSEEMDLHQMFTPDYVNHVIPEPPGGWSKGVEGAKQIMKAYRLASPDLTLRVKRQIVCGDLVVTEYVATGTHTAKAFFGRPANGRTYKLKGVGIYRIDDGKFAESWGSWDTYTLMQQMGILPKEAFLSV